MSDPLMTIYGVEWCGDCIRTRRFLSKHNVSYHWINIDRDKEAETLVLKVNRGMRSIPTIIFQDGSMLVEPSNDRLAQKLGISLS